MNSADRRALTEYVRNLPKETRAALMSDDFEVFCYYGWGVIPNVAQLESHEALRSFPPGTVHLWRFANRTGKTAGLMLDHSWFAFKKWGYQNADIEGHQAYVYRTLHSAPLNRLMGKAWDMMDSMIKGSSILQQNPVTNRQRKAPLAPLFTADTGRTRDGSDAMWVACANNSIIDFLSTQGGAGRLESETWWFIDWDEFVRQQPIGDVPTLFDQTFLPRSSDHMAPLVLSGTDTEDADPVYAELEDMAERSPHDFNLMTYERSANFSQSTASIERQLRMSLDPAIAARSVLGQSGEGGRGTLFPTKLLKSAFDETLPVAIDDGAIERLHAMEWPRYRIVSMFDHAADGDLCVVQSWLVPDPMPEEEELIGCILGVGLAIKRSGSHLTPALLIKFAVDEVLRLGSDELIVDGTGEGGHLVYAGLREELGGDCGVISCDFGQRGARKYTTNKEEGLQALQLFLGWGLEYAVDETGWVDDYPDAEPGTFGILRLPADDEWRRLRRELATLKRDDAHMRQDRAMTAVMGAWRLRRELGAGASLARPFRMTANRRRGRRSSNELAIVR